jgi:hypothetical protein
MVRELLNRGCPSGQQPSYMDINGTTFLTCVKYDTFNNTAVGLGVGLGLGIPFLIIFCIVIWKVCTHMRRMNYDDHPNVESIIVVPRRRWEDFIHEGSYIRRIAQLLESEEVIPKDIGEYFVENFPDVWEKVNKPEFDFVSRSAKLIKVLFDEQAKLEHKDVSETIKEWEEKLVDKAGREFGWFIMERVKRMS